MRMHFKILIQIFGDPHAWFAGGGIALVTLPTLADAGEVVKFFTICGGFVIVILSGLHKWILIKRDMKKNNRKWWS